MARFKHSVYMLEKKLSIAALSQQLPELIMLHWMPLSVSRR